MYDKPTIKNPDKQAKKLPAGLLPGDFNTELFGTSENRKVFALCNGATIPFRNINPTLKATLYKMLLQDPVAMADLKDMDYEEALEEFAFCLYGAADGSPDFSANGRPGTTENFTCSGNCRCLKWPSKNITINGNCLTPRELQVALELASDKTDKLIAHELHISPNTLIQHKRNIYAKAGVQSRPGFVDQCFKNGIAQ